MMRADTRVALIIVVAMLLSCYVILQGAYAHHVEPAEIKMCISESGHKRLPCPGSEHE